MEKGIVHTNHNSIQSKAMCEHYSFHLVLFSDADEMYELWLPQFPEGFYYFSNHHSLQFLNISARDGHWIATCKKPAYFQLVHHSSSRLYLSASISGLGGNRGYLFCSFLTQFLIAACQSFIGVLPTRQPLLS